MDLIPSPRAISFSQKATYGELSLQLRKASQLRPVVCQLGSMMRRGFSAAALLVAASAIRQNLENAQATRDVIRGRTEWRLMGASSQSPTVWQRKLASQQNKIACVLSESAAFSTNVRRGGAVCTWYAFTALEQCVDLDGFTGKAVVCPHIAAKQFVLRDTSC